MRILAVGDSYMPPRYFQAGVRRRSQPRTRSSYVQVDAASAVRAATPSELKLREYPGLAGASWSSAMAGVEVLVVQGAPVTDEVLDASAALQLVGCARGGPVNVDVDAVTARGLPLVNTPGKNAEAVADLTLAFLVMLARGLPEGAALPRRGEPAAGQLGGRASSSAATCAATRSGSSATGRSASASRAAPLPSG